MQPSFDKSKTIIYTLISMIVWIYLGSYFTTEDEDNDAAGGGYNCAAEWVFTILLIIYYTNLKSKATAKIL